MVMRMDRPLLVGVGRTNITPPVGLHLVGYGLRTDPSTRVNDELTATVLVLGDGTRRMAIAACDVVGFGDADADVIRQDIMGLQFGNLLGGGGDVCGGKPGCGRPLVFIDPRIGYARG
jgi:hypothetical protein